MLVAPMDICDDHHYHYRRAHEIHDSPCISSPHWRERSPRTNMESLYLSPVSTRGGYEFVLQNPPVINTVSREIENLIALFDEADAKEEYALEQERKMTEERKNTSHPRRRSKYKSPKQVTVQTNATSQKNKTNRAPPEKKKKKPVPQFFTFSARHIRLSNSRR